MDTRRLEIFLKLMETRSFSKTAAALGLTQPSVSASLKALEESLGQQLFKRTPRAVTPLPAAETLAPFAADIVEAVGRAVWAVGRQLAGAKEKLTVGASSVPAETFLPRALAVFDRQNPGILVRVKTGDSRSIARRVADGELDLGLVGAHPENQDLKTQVFGRDRLVLLAAEGLARDLGSAPASLEELAAWPLIIREEGSGTRAAVLAGLSGSFTETAGRMTIKAEVDGAGPALALARTGYGAVIVSNLLLPDLNLQGLKVLKLDFLPGRQFYLVRRKSYRLTPPVETLVSLIKNSAESLS